MDIFKKLETLGYTVEIDTSGIMVLKAGNYKFYGNEIEVIAWLKENGELG